MYSSYATAAFAVREKGSFPYAHLYVSHRQAETRGDCCRQCSCRRLCCCGESSSGGLAICGGSRNPSFAHGYYSLQYSFIPQLLSRKHVLVSRAWYRALERASGPHCSQRHLQCRRKPSNSCCGYHVETIGRMESGCSKSSCEDDVDDEMESIYSDCRRLSGSSKGNNFGKQKNGIRSNKSYSEFKERYHWKIDAESSHGCGHSVNPNVKEAKDISKRRENGHVILESKRKPEIEERSDNKSASTSKTVHDQKAKERKEQSVTKFRVDTTSKRVYDQKAKESKEKSEKKLLVDSTRLAKDQHFHRQMQSSSNSSKRKDGMVEVGAERMRPSGHSFHGRKDEYGGKEEQAIGGKETRTSLEFTDAGNRKTEISMIAVEASKRCDEFRGHIIDYSSSREESSNSTSVSNLYKNGISRTDFVPGMKNNSIVRKEPRGDSHSILGTSGMHKDYANKGSRLVTSTHIGEENVEEQQLFVKRMPRVEPCRIATTFGVLETSEQRNYSTKRTNGNRLNRSSVKQTDTLGIHDSIVKKASDSHCHFVEARAAEEENVSNSLQITRDNRTEINMQEFERITLNKQNIYDASVIVTTPSGSDAKNTICSSSNVDTLSDLNAVNDSKEQQAQSVEWKHMAKQQSSKVQMESNTSILQSYQANSTGMCSQEMVPMGAVNEKENSWDISIAGINKGDPESLHKVDLMESSSSSDKISTHHVGEFIDKLKKELSASDKLDYTSKQYVITQVEEIQRQVNHPPIVLVGDGHVSLSNKDKKLKEGNAREPSRSKMNAPSNDSWDAKVASSEEPSRVGGTGKYASPAVVSDSTNGSDRTDSAISRREHRSLWLYIMDIIRLGWRTSSATQTSSKKCVAGSSYESIDSEAWFSGHQSDGQDSTEIKGDEVTFIETSQSKGSVQYPVSNQSFRNKVELLEPAISASSGSIKDGLLEIASQSREHLGVIEREEGQIHVPSPVALVNQSSLTVTNSVIIDAEIGVLTTTVDSAQLEKDVTEENLSEVGEIQVNDGELKRRKLQKSKQVLQERFDEWEEAYKYEMEQRKSDELFMREALLDAKRAAEIWEMPVGAVLVQNGKIIARGCNLVEELRDSTAHAEMICIREASNLLRTWRLTETTLYVTLEPCPMCAGAILQARIDCVVWGTPNKLLGADGSWVRLFPGVGGSNNSNPSNQVPGPVHPFHPKIIIRRGILETECAAVMHQFFQRRRKKDKKADTSSPPACLPLSINPGNFFDRLHNVFCVMFCL